MFARLSNTYKDAMITPIQEMIGHFLFLMHLVSLFSANGPHFDPWIAPSNPSKVYHSVFDPPEDPHFVPEMDFL